LVFDDGITDRTLSISDAEVIEGNAGPVIARFFVTLSAPSSQTITVQYATADGTAQAPGHYLAIPLTMLTFLPGEVSQPIDVMVLGDDLFESDERFFVNLSNPTIATLLDAQGLGTIRNDDPRRTRPDFDLDELDGGNGFKMSGSTPGSRIGWSVSSAGDVNGDGIDDLILAGTDRAYVVFGSRDEFPADLDLSTLDGTNGFTLTGAAPDELRGLTVSAAGDVNGDGLADLIIGASLTDAGGADTGAAYVVLGKVTPFAASISLPTLNGTDGFRLRGSVPGNRAGLSVSGAGDVNGDGFDDVIIGGTAASPSLFGVSYVFFGHGGPFAADFDLNTVSGGNGFKIIYPLSFDDDGMMVSGAGDVNGDGLADLLVGTPGTDAGGKDTGACYVIFGQTSFPISVATSALDGTNGFRLTGPTIGDRLGYSVGSAGDVNNDGFADLIVGARGSGRVAPCPARPSWCSAARAALVRILISACSMA
jgi:hypothetical protein